MLCVADLGPILEAPARHLPYYVNLLTADGPNMAAVGEGARIYDRFNERVLEAILLRSTLQGNRDAQRILRTAFAINAHGVLIECLKGEDRPALLQASRRLRRALLNQLMNESLSFDPPPGGP